MVENDGVFVALAETTVFLLISRRCRIIGSRAWFSPARRGAAPLPARGSGRSGSVHRHREVPLDAHAFRRCLVARVSELTRAPAEFIAIGGKRSKEPIHMVSAFAARQRLVIGQVAVAQKSNEIVAIPALLGVMAIEGAVVTIDAMARSEASATKIISSKGNQGTLHEDVKIFCGEQQASGFKGIDKNADYIIAGAQPFRDGRRGPWADRNTTIYCDP
ncbi:ISAs1 family transposase [Aurantimonas sp. A2-1-M11]|uniref:ISAs1 family transposase n=1 Tax=Aurantimonas sp. A2-1-M11 TaxID=3113712 RepID=UPI002F9365E7